MAKKDATVKELEFLGKAISFIIKACEVIPIDVQKEMIKKKFTIDDFIDEYDKYRHLDEKEVN